MTSLLLPLKETIKAIMSLDPQSLAASQDHLDRLTKPIGSLGRLEAVAAQMSAIHSGNLELPLKKAVYVFAADHGVTEEGVSAYPKEVTAQMVINFLSGGAAINVLSRTHNAELNVIDVGVDASFADASGLILSKIRRGTRNMKREAAMTREEVDRALAVGLDMASVARDKGQTLIATGEMGIGNTTAASALTAVLTKQPVANVTGKGTGLDLSAKHRKVGVIEATLARHFGGLERMLEPLEILRCVGGLEIAALTGLVLGAASHRIAIVMDGFISTAAAAIAYAMEPKVKEYLFAGHCSAEPGHQFLLDHIGIEPILSLRMRLGEGTGAVLAMPVIESAMHLYREMATFSAAGVSTANE
jgi:nicotinate-nucleotide--dimethylbenzimidazole phosphoribosyltransferase